MNAVDGTIPVTYEEIFTDYIDLCQARKEALEEASVYHGYTERWVRAMRDLPNAALIGRFVIGRAIAFGKKRFDKYLARSIELRELAEVHTQLLNDQINPMEDK